MSGHAVLCTLLLCVLIVEQQGHVIKERYVLDKHGYPTFDSAPDHVFITFLGPDLTTELGEHEFSDEGVRVVVKKVFELADKDGDGYLDKHELSEWVDKMDRLNDAVDLKQEFVEADHDKDGFISFVDFVQYATDIPTRNELENKFMDGDELDIEKLQSNSERKMEKDGIPNLSYHLQHFYKLWLLADKNEDGHLNWNEFIVFSRPDEFEETYVHSTGSKYKKFDNDKDKRYSLEEFKTYYAHNVLIPDLLPEGHRKPEDLFTKCDVDQDGYLSYEEGDNCIRSFIAVNHQNIEWLLDDTDINEDGKLSEEEVMQTFDDLVSNDDYFYRHDEL